MATDPGTPYKRLIAWCEVLESPDAPPQGTGQLRRGEARCCLGVADDFLFSLGCVTKLLPDDNGALTEADESEQYNRRGSMLGLTKEDQRELYRRNDGNPTPKHTFPQIAAYVRAEIAPRVLEQERANA
jgi:hypothetical protein